MTVIRRSCFTADNLVLTKEGYKRIEDIKEGDLVLTKENRFQKVMDRSAIEDKPTVLVQATGVEGIHCTPDHNILVRSLKTPRGADNRKVSNTLLPAEYKEAKDLTNNDYLVINKNAQERVVEHATLPTRDPNFWYIVGRVLADGWVCSPYIRRNTGKEELCTMLCCGKNKKDKLTEKLNLVAGLF